MTLQLELGKKYLNRLGEVVEINEYGRPESRCPWYGSDNQSYTEDGKWYPDEENPEDLVSEYVEPSTKPVEISTNIPHVHSTKIPHKHKDLIIEWANGAEIEYLEEEDGEFYKVHGRPNWDNDTTYRVKPEKKVEVVSAWVSNGTAQVHVLNPNLSLTFEDGKLIKAEVL